jgi:phage tail P2-like protein
MKPSLLPPPLAADLSMRALETVFARSSKIDLSPMVVYDFDHVVESALPLLAEQFHILGAEGWALAETITEKRALLKRAIELHRHKGTPWAIKQALAALSFNTRIFEWFDYDGDPYRFRVEVESPERAVDEALWARLVELINAYKNVRSHLETLRLIAVAHLNISVGMAALSGETVSVSPLTVTAATVPASSVFIAIGYQAWSTTHVYPGFVAK